MEAEGRAAIRGTVRTTVALLTLITAAVLILGGIVLIVVAAGFGMVQAGLHLWAALLIIGLVLIVIGIAGGIYAYLFSQSRSN